MPKKSNTRRTDGRIAVQVYLGRIDGKRKYKTVYGSTQKEAEQKATELKSLLNKGIDLTSCDRTFQFWAKKYLQSRKSSLTPSNYKTTESRLQYFVDRFGDLQIEKIRLCDAEAAINDLSACNPVTGKPSAKKTLIGYSSVLKRCLDYAVANRIIDYNPFSILSVPEGSGKNTRDALTAEQQKWVSETQHRAQLGAMIMLYAGLRRGELTALSWSDIDFKNRTITVNKSYDFRENEVKTTKTPSGIRAVPIPDVLFDFLKAQRITSTLVFPNKNGEYMRESAWRRLWKGYMHTLNRKYGDFVNIKILSNKLPMVIDEFTPHQLRHTYCTLLYEAGIDAVTAKGLMGHKDISTTLGIYTHLSRDKAEKDISKLNDFLQEKNTNASQMQVKKA